ncbi:MAG TPA: Os1348 family NHLP clan protein [Chloroflexota bacterium]|jgi:hypothetical protein|nr:Os1348 family NHLP clan protein [Chloroflexota bacterium]
MSSQPSVEQIAQMVPQRELSPGFQQMLGRLLADPEFRKSMATDPEGTLQRANIQLSPQELERVRAMTPEDRKRLFEDVDTRNSKGWWYVIFGWFWWW